MDKLYNDSIHGHILLPSYLFKFIDTPEFQRLRRIKQTGVVNLVFSGAVHDRAMHSIGVAYLANKMAKKIKKKFPDAGMTDNLIKLITISGLLHDIGHGPMSHNFELIARKINPNYSHEDTSCRIIDRFSDKFDSKEDVEMVKNIIQGNIPEGEKRYFIYEIVSNPTTSIDVDKMDYFVRDSKYANI